MLKCTLLLALSFCGTETQRCEKYANFWSPLVGIWSRHTEVNGNITTETCEIRRGKSQIAIIGRTVAETAPADSIGFFDSMRNARVAYEVARDQVLMRVGTIDVDGHPSVTAGVNVQWNEILISPDGAAKTRSTTWHFESVDVDRVVYSVSIEQDDTLTTHVTMDRTKMDIRTVASPEHVPTGADSVADKYMTF